MNRDADTTLAILAVLLTSLPGDSEKGMPSLQVRDGVYRLSWGQDHSNYFQAPTLTELAERGR